MDRREQVGMTHKATKEHIKIDSQRLNLNKSVVLGTSNKMGGKTRQTNIKYLKPNDDYIITANCEANTSTKMGGKIIQTNKK